MLERLKGMFERNRQMRQIDGMDARDLNDIGLERTELEMLVQTPPDVFERQSEMARRFDLQDSDFGADRHDYALVVDRCAHCGAAGECREFLAAPDAKPADATFCPNAELYGELARDKSH